MGWRVGRGRRGSGRAGSRRGGTATSRGGRRGTPGRGDHDRGRRGGRSRGSDDGAWRRRRWYLGIDPIRRGRRIGGIRGGRVAARTRREGAGRRAVLRDGSDGRRGHGSPDRGRHGRGRRHVCGYGLHRGRRAVHGLGTARHGMVHAVPHLDHDGPHAERELGVRTGPVRSGRVLLARFRTGRVRCGGVRRGGVRCGHAVGVDAHGRRRGALRRRCGRRASGEQHAEQPGGDRQPGRHRETQQQTAQGDTPTRRCRYDRHLDHELPRLFCLPSVSRRTILTLCRSRLVNTPPAGNTPEQMESCPRPGDGMPSP